MPMLYYNGIFHSLRNETDTFYGMEVSKGRIVTVYPQPTDIPSRLLSTGVDLKGLHVYPCLIDSHTHMLLTISVMAMGFNACEITENGVSPSTLVGIGNRIRNYVSTLPKNQIIAVNNYIPSAMDEHRMPTKNELDCWAMGHPAVLYSIDGHSTSLSTSMLQLIGIDPSGHCGILQGEENERAQGRIIDILGKSIRLSSLAKGIARFHNYCADYGISMVGALEGNGDSNKDSTTRLIARLARHFDIQVRLYLQYVDGKRLKAFAPMMKHLRVGGCGDWEMDGSVGSHSASFPFPFLDSNKTAPCYYSQDEVNHLTKEFDAMGYQIASHAIGESGIERILTAFEQLPSHSNGVFHRIEHFEFHNDNQIDRVAKGKFAVVMQPGYAWIDNHYLHSYEQILPENILGRMKLKSLYEKGICVCGSSDSPVQDMDPYLQMLGMVDFYQKNESLTPYQAFSSYTVHAAKALLEDADYGSLGVGKVADFFTAQEDFFSLSPSEIISFRPITTYYGGKPYQKKSGSLFELIKMLLTKRKMI